MAPLSKLERFMASVVLGTGLLCAAALWIALDSQANAIERDLSARAQLLAKQLEAASPPLSAFGVAERQRLADSLRGATQTPELDALVAIAPSGDTLYSYAQKPGLIDPLLGLGADPSTTLTGHLIAHAPLAVGHGEPGRIQLALSNERATRARALRDRAGALTLLISIGLLLGLLALQRRLQPMLPAQTIPPTGGSQRSGAAATGQPPRLDDRLLHSIGREARTSLSNAIAMVGLLLDTKLDPKQRRYAQTLEESARGLLRTIDEVLEFARAAGGRYPVRRAEFDLREAVDDSLERFAAQAHAKGLELLRRIDVDVPPFAVADADRLRQVLAHIIGNGVKFTERGEVIVQARMESGEGPPRARIEVRDSGPGIAKYEQASVFDGPGGNEELLVRPNRGVGLGLAISRRLVEAMGGEIGLQSTPGAGSCFWFTVPVKAGSKLQSLRPIALARRALVVDQSRIARDVLKAEIERWQLDCDTTSSAYDAFSRLEQEGRSSQPFDVVVMSERTSDLTGAELLRAIEGHAAMRQVPLVLLTYKGSALSASKIDSVAAATLTKPVTSAALHRAITQVVERRNASLRAPRPVRDASASGEAPRALVVDDNEVNQFAVVELLTELGFAADVARNGLEAVEMAARHNYAMIFMDCEMPEMDGYEATREIRRSTHPYSHVPIIALTAHTGPEERAKGLASGMDEYMAKPVRQDALEATITRWTSTARESAKSPAPTPASEPPAELATTGGERP